ncbi:rod shape-determining protein RodA [Mizugakiibacter sediminis]|uniref:Rod shape-determining protein RodA n=1 Tax=Mizugakiibacter sediminis TaxID=1475481 RepID=A0A0K8QNF7_9GAMM|nr:DUF4399 domain-containing protein [Mizugakiibacter sediminis]GAP65962.1 rod shape-determining protein RodA [Mizugakiibacter sediminis]
MKRTMTALGLVLAAAGAAAQTAGTLPRSKAPEHARLYFISPKDGATVGRDVTVRFGLEGMGVAPAGVDKAGTGHHHLLVDVKALPPADQPIPKDEHHLHFGNGQTETVLHLAPGTHTLQLDLGDANHMQFDPPLVSPKITIRVK